MNQSIEKFSDEAIADMRSQMVKRGACAFADAEGKHVVLALSQVLGLQGERLMLAYEGHGMKIFDLSRPMNTFRLVEEGFSIRTAPMLADMVNRVCGLGAKKATLSGAESGQRPLLEHIESATREEKKS